MLPLPLELTRPVEMSSSLEDVLKEAWAVETTKYNSETQVREDSEGVPMILNGGTKSNQNTQSFNVLTGIAIDAAVDVQVDDNDIL